mgnify:CR=1 FL=1|jgi:hypothetical protein
MIDSTVYKITENNQQFESPICYTLGVDFNLNYALSSGVSYMLIGVNYALRVVIILLIMYIGIDTESGQT